MNLNRNAVAALAGTAVLLVGGGTALAAKGDGDRSARCEARLAKIAEKRGVSVDQLKTDVEARLIACVDAALAAGRISPERAARLKERIAQGEICESPAARPAARIVLARHGMLRAASSFLGLDANELRAQLPGTSLAELAQKQGKAVEALEAAMVAPAKAGLAKAVASGGLTQAQADRALERLEQLAARLAQRTFPAR